MKKWILRCLLLLFTVTFLVSGGLLLNYYWKDAEREADYDKLSNMVDSVRQETQYDVQLPEYEQVTDPKTGELRQILREYAHVYLLNPDMVGWITIPGTKVDYPVMHRPENTDYYLKRDFFQKSSAAGSIYVREECDVFAPSDNITIYGHRMNSGAMFGELMEYKEQSFWEDHRYIRFDTLTQWNTYEIFAVFKISASTKNGFPYHTFVDMTEEEFTEFVNQCKTRSLYDTGITPQYGDHLITLSTCEKGRSNTRFVVVAKGNL